MVASTRRHLSLGPDLCQQFCPCKSFSNCPKSSQFFGWFLVCTFAVKKNMDSFKSSPNEVNTLNIHPTVSSSLTIDLDSIWTQFLLPKFGKENTWTVEAGLIHAAKCLNLPHYGHIGVRVRRENLVTPGTFQTFVKMFLDILRILQFPWKMAKWVIQRLFTWQILFLLGFDLGCFCHYLYNSLIVTSL